MPSKGESLRSKHDSAYHVYVVRLSDDVLTRRKFRKANPD